MARPKPWWVGMPNFNWYNLTPEQQQEIIDYYKAHPDEPETYIGNIYYGTPGIPSIYLDDNDGVNATINDVPTSSEPTSSDSGPRISRITFKVEPAPPSRTPFHIEPYGDNDVPFTSDLNPAGAVWGDIPWELLTERQKQDIIDYYKAHPDIVNPYYNYCHVGKPPYQQKYLPYTPQNKVETTIKSVVSKANQTVNQYGWIILILVAVAVYFVFFRKKRRR